MDFDRGTSSCILEAIGSQKRYWCKSFHLVKKEARDSIFKEVSALLDLRTCHFVTVKAVFLDLLHIKVRVLCEYSKIGSLDAILQQRGSLPEPVISVLMRQVGV